MTTFKKKVLTAVSGIPRGSVMTYKGVAVLAGSPNAARAVGQIMANNFDLSVPCHRVVRSDGGVGAYNRGGASRKKQLLNREGVQIENGRVPLSFIKSVSL